MEQKSPMLQARDLRFRYDPERPDYAVDGVSLEVARGEFVAVLGANGCGKSTLAKHLNAILLPEAGTVLVEDTDTRNEDHLYDIRQKVGMVFQRPTPFPMSIYDNIAYGVRLFEKLPKSELDDRVEWALKKAALWTDVKDKLSASGFALSGGQQQRLCIARAVAVKPEVLLLDEPCSALDPISTAKIEDLINELKKEYTVVIVTHSMQQAARISDFTAYMYLGELIEFGETEMMFTHPTKKATEDYITGRFG